ncbi:MAG: V-type ATP synthase subunit I [Bacillota bacterium]|nr:V-type ATP synthase subunit I [Bacillota bacterium]
MAVTRMKFVTVIGHADLRAEVVARLHSLGIMQITEAYGAMDAGASGYEAKAKGSEAAREAQSRLADLDTRLSALESCFAHLSRYSPVQKGMVESFLSPRTEIDGDTWRKADGYDVAGVVATCQRDEARLGEMRSREAELGARRKELEPLAQLPLSLGDLEGTETVAVFFGQTTPAGLAALEVRLAETTGIYHVERLGAVGRRNYVLVLHRRDAAAVADILRADLEPASVPETAGTVAQATEQMQAEMAALAREREEIAARALELAGERATLQAAYDHLLLARQRLDAQSWLGETERTFVVHGWCPKKALPRLERGLAGLEDATAVSVRDPRPDERPPVTLDNKPLAAPFEIVTNIFGWPSYDEVDPTPILAPFFAVFFALALTDAGYGLVMMAYCLWMMSRKSTPKGSHKFFRLLTFGGFVTVVIGALTGGWFGNALDFLPSYAGFFTRAKNAIILLDPVKEPMKLMVLSLGLGVVHLLFGIGTKMYRNIRDGEVAAALMDQGLWLLLLPSLVLFGAGGAMGMPGVAAGAKYVAFAAAGGLILTQGRASKNIIARLGGGLYSLYGLIGYLSDTLSYTRLLALGLATASLGMAINQIALMVRPVPFVGIILMLVIMAFGHGLSLVINVFGAFIHSGRLQFVEFFSKFFEGGGKAFRPFAERPRYTQVGQG